MPEFRKCSNRCLNLKNQANKILQSHFRLLSVKKKGANQTFYYIFHNEVTFMGLIPLSLSDSPRETSMSPSCKLAHLFLPHTYNKNQNPITEALLGWLKNAERRDRVCRGERKWIWTLSPPLPTSEHHHDSPVTTTTNGFAALRLAESNSCALTTTL